MELRDESQRRSKAMLSGQVQGLTGERLRESLSILDCTKVRSRGNFPKTVLIPGT